MYLPSGDQVAELPRASFVWSLPSAFIRNRSEMWFGSFGMSRLLSNTIFSRPATTAGTRHRRRWPSLGSDPCVDDRAVLVRHHQVDLAIAVARIVNAMAGTQCPVEGSHLSPRALHFETRPKSRSRGQRVLQPILVCSSFSPFRGDKGRHIDGREQCPRAPGTAKTASNFPARRVHWSDRLWPGDSDRAPVAFTVRVMIVCGSIHKHRPHDVRDAKTHTGRLLRDCGSGHGALTFGLRRAPARRPIVPETTYCGIGQRHVTAVVNGDRHGRRPGGLSARAGAIEIAHMHRHRRHRGDALHASARCTSRVSDDEPHRTIAERCVQSGSPSLQRPPCCRRSPTRSA